MSSELDELTDFLTKLAEQCGQKFRFDQGLLAAVFLADALRAGGVDKSALALGLTTMTIHRESAGEVLAAAWPKRHGDDPRATLQHHVLIARLQATYIVDPVIKQLNREGPYVSVNSLPDYYGPLDEQAIYQSPKR